jgi:hypothetical protein
MAIKKELWVKYIVGNLFKGAEFMQFCKRADEYVVQGALVHIPQAGAKPVVVKNRSTLPATIAKRTDTDIVYLLDEFTSNPTLISNAERYEESPDKLASVLDEHVQTLREAIGDEIIYNWLAGFAATGPGGPSSAIAAATVIRTTGANVAAHMPAATGTRKLFLKEDLQRARTIMNKQNVPKEDRYALISSDMLDQLMQDADLKKRDMALELDMKNGVLSRLYGFNILERSYVATYDNASTPVIKPVGAAGATTDNDVVLCYQKNCVELALGEVKVFEELDKPDYYGNVYSALVRAGGRKTRKNAEGVVAIVQGV